MPSENCCIYSFFENLIFQAPKTAAKRYDFQKWSAIVFIWHLKTNLEKLNSTWLFALQYIGLRRKSRESILNLIRIGTAHKT